MDIAVLGYGVVGSGVAEVISLNEQKITGKIGEKMNVKYILDLRKFPGDKNKDKIIDDFNIILNDGDVKIVAEAMGGLHPAFEFVSFCLKAGKSVVTSNKELVAEKGDILLELAKENNVNFMFEASVGGGIPVLRPIIQCLAANEITEVAGILNGTTNFILSKMIFDSMSFDDALKLAQDNGYAEKDPTADIEGFDACRKICILAALCFGNHVYPKSVYTEGITKITLEDVDYARSWGGVIKLLGKTCVFLWYLVKLYAKSVSKLSDSNRNSAGTEIVTFLDDMADLFSSEKSLKLSLCRCITLLYLSSAY